MKCPFCKYVYDVPNEKLVELEEVTDWKEHTYLYCSECDSTYASEEHAREFEEAFLRNGKRKEGETYFEYNKRFWSK